MGARVGRGRARGGGGKMGVSSLMLLFVGESDAGRLDGGASENRCRCHVNEGLVGFPRQALGGREGVAL